MTEDQLDPARLARLKTAADALPRDVAPARDLWPDIRARIAPRRSVVLRPYLLAAASALIAVGATAWVMDQRTERALADAESNRAFATVAAFERSSAELAATLERRGATLDPRTRAVLEQSLRTIDEAIAEARVALDSDPRNPAVQAFVAAAYRQKIDFLRRANDVAVSQGP
jgi:hypothetical protein